MWAHKGVGFMGGLAVDDITGYAFRNFNVHRVWVRNADLDAWKFSSSEFRAQRCSNSEFKPLGVYSFRSA